MYVKVFSFQGLFKHLCNFVLNISIHDNKKMKFIKDIKI